MVSVKAVSVLALVAGAAMAAPTPVEKGAALLRRWNGRGYHWWSQSEDDSTTLTIPEGWTEGAPVATVVTVVTETAAAQPQAPPAAAPSPAPAPAAAAAPAPAAAAWSAPASQSTAAASTSNDGSYLSIANQFRSAAGLPDFTQSSTLEANALKTSTNSVGGLIHELNPGTMAQVLAPGTFADFEKVYVGGWLCEVPSSPGLNGICSTLSAGWDYDGQTGHNEILTNPGYSQIGCAESPSTGVMACDLA